MPAAPHGKEWLMGAGLLCLLAGMICIDVVFICLLIGKGSVVTLIITQGAAALLVLAGLILLRTGGKKSVSTQSS